MAMVSTTESSLLVTVTLGQIPLNVLFLGGLSTVLMDQHQKILATGNYRTHGVQAGATKDSCEYRSQMVVVSVE